MQITECAWGRACLSAAHGRVNGCDFYEGQVDSNVSEAPKYV